MLRFQMTAFILFFVCGYLRKVMCVMTQPNMKDVRKDSETMKL